jgi:LysM repeat protein
VQGGDSLYSIARRFGTDSKTLAELNGMDAGEQLQAGRRIRLPGGAEDRIAPKPTRGVAASSEPVKLGAQASINCLSVNSRPS